MRRTTRLRQLLAAPEILIMPGVHDALGARLAEQAGFSALVSGGYAASATLLGQPDISQLSYTEMVDYYARLCDATDLPLLADADTGFGGPSNVERTVKGYERAGVAALLLEDQVFPKRCGHDVGKQVIPRADYIAKLKAALDARRDPDLVIVARTDATAVYGVDEAIERLSLAREMGADLLFADALETPEQMRRLCRETGGPCIANIIEGGRTPEMSAAELAQIGFVAVMFALGITYAVAKAMRDHLAALKRVGSNAANRDNMLTFAEFNGIVGLPGRRDREAALAQFADDFVGRTAPPSPRRATGD